MGPQMNYIEREVVTWLHQVVIGLNLCPFASRPTSEGRVRFFISHATSEEDLLEELSTEMRLLDEKAATEIETTLLIVPKLLQDFFDYTQFLDWAQAHLKREGWLGVYQLASFHPQYCFAGADPDDAENLTNRAPYPIVHIIREQSLSNALNYVADVAEIPERNKRRVSDLSAQDKRKLFPYLFGIK